MAALDSLRAAFAGRLLTEPADMAAFLTDWRGKWTGSALAVAQPDTPEDVAHVVRWCAAHNVPVVPQGGNTGLSGGATPDTSGQALVLSLTRLRGVRGIDRINKTITVDAGVTLQAVQDAAADAGLLFPLSLAAQGSCTIGGNLATNAGGVQVLRYGNARELCLGLEVVTPQGELWNGLRGLRKDNTGYDLRDLFIGSEGTLGVITGATLKLFPRPTCTTAALAAVPDPQRAVALLQLAQQHLASGLTAFELMSDTCLQLVQKHVPGARLPLAERSPWYVLIELSSAASEAATEQLMQDFLAVGLEDGLMSDVALASNLAQFKAFWALREDISESQGAEGKTIKHDVSLPISEMAQFIELTNAALTAEFSLARLVVFGHLGDGNLHYNVSPPADLPREQTADFLAQEPAMNRLVHDAVHRLGGSISAEHGLGVLRRDEALRYRSPLETRLMQSVKAALDPQQLMNPGKLLAPLTMLTTRAVNTA